MFTCLQRLFTDRGYAVGWGIIGFVAMAASVVVVAITLVIAIIANTSENDYPSNVITVEGVGEVSSKPDVAIFSFSVQEQAATTEAAQTALDTKMNTLIAYLEDADVEDEDIKTTGYNIYPRYEWIEQKCLFDQPCTPGKNELVGYEASQNVSVKVREIEEAATLLSGIGKLGVSNVSGLQFTIDDDASLKEEAQKLAIQDAKERAKRLAKELGVSLKDVVSFYENGNGGGYPEPYMMEARAMSSDMAEESMLKAALPTGENVISSRVSITYEIK